MKKTKRPLHLDRETVRILTSNDQLGIRGGLPTDSANTCDTCQTCDAYKCAATSAAAVCSVNICIDTRACPLATAGC